MTRAGRITVLLCLIALSSAHASAQSVDIVQGVISPNWDGSLASFSIAGSGSNLSAEFYGGSPTSALQAGTTADLSTTIDINCCVSPRAFSESVNGTTYDNVWLRGQLRITARPFTVPPVPPAGTFNALAAPFTLSGEVAGYADAAFTSQLFAVSVSGAGVAQFRPTGIQGDTYVASGGAPITYTLTTPIPSQWTSLPIGGAGDLGNDGTTGEGLHFVGGSGSDIWATSDSFQYVFRPFQGDLRMVARVVDQQNTSPFAKAGLMIRQSIDPSSPEVILDVRPNHAIEFMTRSAFGEGTTFLAGATAAAGPVWLMLSRSGDQVTGATSVDGVSWMPIGTATLGGDALAGKAVTSHDDGALNQAVFDSFYAIDVPQPPPVGPLPAPWLSADVGAVSTPGNDAYQAGTFTIRGDGNDVWGTADSFRFVYQPISGHGEFQARVTGLENTNGYAKAGIMVRTSLDPSSASVILDVKPDGGIEFMARASDGAATDFLGGGFTEPFPVSLKITRTSGQLASLYVAWVYDTASQSWIQVGSTTVSIPRDALIGFAVTSHDPGRLAAATLDVAAVVKNLITRGDFEDYTVPSLGPPGWVSDTPLRQVDAVSDSSQPYNGIKDGLCASNGGGDCGIYQDITITESGNYIFSIFAAADRPGGLVGVNVNGRTEGAPPVSAFGAGNYREYRFGFHAYAGDVVRVWMYSPSTPGFVAIDDASLMRYLGPT